MPPHSIPFTSEEAEPQGGETLGKVPQPCWSPSQPGTPHRGVPWKPWGGVGWGGRLIPQDPLFCVFLFSGYEVRANSVSKMQAVEEINYCRLTQHGPHKEGVKVTSFQLLVSLPG